MAPLSDAEKLRCYRARRDADPERRERYLSKEKERWRNDREEGRRKKVSELSEREKRAQREKWREKKKKQRDSARARTTSQSLTDEPSRPEVIMKENIGQWCIVLYDGELYPGM